MYDRSQDTTGSHLNVDRNRFLDPDAPAPDLYYVFGDGADHLLADLHRMVTVIYQTLIPPEKRHTVPLGCNQCDAGPEDECTDDCPSRHGDYGEDEPNG